MNLTIPPDYQRLYSAHSTLTPALWKAYRPNALATEPDARKLLEQWSGMEERPPTYSTRRAIQALHGGLGLATELEEFRNADSPENTIEEIGDMCWYLVQIIEGLNIPIEEVAQEYLGERQEYDDTEHDILIFGHDIVSDIKRIIFYNKQTVRERLVGNINNLLHLFDNCYYKEGVDMVQILEWNSYKLRELRYKNGFSNQAAVDRLDKPGEQD